MRILKIAVAVSVIFAVIFVSCKKKNADDAKIDASSKVSEKLTVTRAEAYHKSIENKFGSYNVIKISGKTEKNFKKVDFSQAYFGENETSFFVEVPISYTRRQVAFRGSSIPTPTLNKMIANSFDRLVIYQDKTSGMISEKIVTFIPSDEYLASEHRDLRNNHYQNITNSFVGYVSYTDWKGKFLSTQYYNKGLVASSVTRRAASPFKTNQINQANDIDCEDGFIYTFYAWCEDVDEWGNGVNCDYVIISTPAQFCEYVPSHTHPVTLPGSTDPYWEGYPDPIPNSGAPCPTGPRTIESPITWVNTNGSSADVYFIEGCVCPGYSWIIFEDTTTGTEYTVPITNHYYDVVPGCSYYWRTALTIPTEVPNGEYYVRVYFDGDTFYHQFEQSNGVIRRFKHIISR